MAFVRGPDASHLPVLNPVFTGQSWTVPGAVVHALATPGHCHDHVSYFIQESGVLFSGDCILGSNVSTVVTSLSDYHQSVDRMIDKAPKMILPGHGQAVITGCDTYLKKMKSHQDRLTNLVRRKLKGISGRGGSFATCQISEMVYGAAAKRYPNACATNVSAHLSYLAELGEVQCGPTVERRNILWTTLPAVKPCGSTSASTVPASQARQEHVQIGCRATAVMPPDAPIPGASHPQSIPSVVSMSKIVTFKGSPLLSSPQRPQHPQSSSIIGTRKLTSNKAVGRMEGGKRPDNWHRSGSFNPFVALSATKLLPPPNGSPVQAAGPTSGTSLLPQRPPTRADKLIHASRSFSPRSPTARGSFRVPSVATVEGLMAAEHNSKYPAPPTPSLQSGCVSANK